MKKFPVNITFIVIAGIALSLLTPSYLFSESIKNSPHGDRSKVLKGCYSCHKGHGGLNAPALPDGGSDFCYRCHGNPLLLEETISKGDLAKNTQTANLQDVFRKPYRHPVEKFRSGRYDETIPEKNPAAERRSGCTDCHHHHYVSEHNPFAGLRGIAVNGEVVNNITFEFELCFKCHSYGANLPFEQTNKAILFNTKNPSYHPVVGPGKNNDVPSLFGIPTISSTIKCTDCHGNDDFMAPKGPHGSNYKYILKKNFADTDGNESTIQYELCYSCHRRESILNNISFQFHYRHIVEIGASCRTCHNPHGSLQYSNMIDFSNTSISASGSGRIEFRDLGIRKGECYLTCHEKNHNPASYPSVPTTPSSLKPSVLKNRR
jgi:predicted CXXCH cytochrome family protein